MPVTQGIPAVITAVMAIIRIATVRKAATRLVISNLIILSNQPLTENR